MKRLFALLAALQLGLTSSSCALDCRSARDCDKGEHCDFASGECLAGCTSDDDCAHRCDLETGRCLPTVIFGAPDATVTSTAADAGP